MREKVGLIEPDGGLRLELVAALNAIGLHAEPFAGLSDFMLYRGQHGCAVLVADERLDALSVRDRLISEGKWQAVIAFAECPEGRRIVDFIRGGGYDYFGLPFEGCALLESITQLSDGQTAYALARQRAAQARAKLEWLSPREAEVLASMAEGQSNKAIGIALGISPRTVEIHRANMLTKLGASSTTEALRMFYEHDLLCGDASVSSG